MNISMGQKYRTESGLPVRIYDVNSGPSKSDIHGAIDHGQWWQPMTWDNKGNAYINLGGLNLKEVPRLIKYRFWLVFGQGGYPMSYIHESKESAMAAIEARGHVAIKEFTGEVEEGEGLC
jgi:hypothetical protein